MSYTTDEKILYDSILRSEGGTNRILLRLYKEYQTKIEAAIAKYRLELDSGKIPDKFVIPRQEALYSQVNQEIDRLYKEIEKEISSQFVDNYEKTYYTHSYNVEKMVNTELSTGSDYILNYPSLPTNTARSALNSEVAGHTFKERILNDKINMQFRLRSLVSQTIIEGQTRAQLSTALENLDSAFATSKVKTTMTARTELLRGYSYGQDDSRKESEAAGVEFTYQWSAALDSKTRSDHRIMDGQKADIVDGEPVFTLPDGSQGAGPRMEGLSAKESVNCRCRRLNLPYGIAPSQRVAKLPDGTWKDVPGNTNSEDWYNLNYQNKKSA